MKAFSGGNRAVYGAGIFFYNKANNNRFNCDFSFNVADSCGGALFFYNTTDNNNFTGSFVNNSALGLTADENCNGGTITFRDVSSNAIFTCDFINNTAAKTGGAVNYRQTPHNITFNGNFVNNTALYGGGVNFFESFDNVTFNGKFIGNSATYGGAIAVKNGAIENVEFINNSAEYGGAIFFEDAGEVNNCNFTHNTASDGGAIVACGDLAISNSIFEDNVATSGTNHISLKENAKVTLSNVVPENLGQIYASNLTADVKEVIYGDTVKIAVKLSYNTIPMAGGIVSVVINNKTYSADIVNGTATIQIPNLDVGEYNCDVVFGGNENCTNATQNVNFKVEKQDIAIIAGNKAYVINYGGKYSVVVKDINNKLLSGIKLTFVLNGKTLGTVNTNSKGVAAITLSAKILKTAKAGKRNLVIKFAGADIYKSTSKTVKITINKEKTKIVAKKKTFKKAQKVKKYTITLKNSKGKAVKKVKVTLKVKGKTYAAKTNAKGKAIFKIKKLSKKGKFNAVVKFKGNSLYKAASKKVKITIK